MSNTYTKSKNIAHENMKKFNVQPTQKKSTESMGSLDNSNTYGNKCVTEWFNKSTTTGMQLISFNDSKILISLTIDLEIHQIELFVPKNYPTIKTGFKLTELDSEFIKLQLVPKINNQLVGKKLNIGKVLDFVEKTFLKYKKSYDEKPKVVLVKNSDEGLHSWNDEILSPELISDPLSVSKIILGTDIVPVKSIPEVVPNESDKTVIPIEESQTKSNMIDTQSEMIDTQSEIIGGFNSEGQIDLNYSMLIISKSEPTIIIEKSDPISEPVIIIEKSDTTNPISEPAIIIEKSDTTSTGSEYESKSEVASKSESESDIEMEVVSRKKIISTSESTESTGSHEATGSTESHGSTESTGSHESTDSDESHESTNSTESNGSDESGESHKSSESKSESESSSEDSDKHHSEIKNSNPGPKQDELKIIVVEDNTLIQPQENVSVQEISEDQFFESKSKEIPVLSENHDDKKNSITEFSNASFATDSDSDSDPETDSNSVSSDDTEQVKSSKQPIKNLSRRPVTEYKKFVCARSKELRLINPNLEQIEYLQLCAKEWNESHLLNIPPTKMHVQYSNNSNKKNVKNNKPVCVPEIPKSETEIIFDIENSIGLYLDLSDYVMITFPFDVNKLISTAIIFNKESEFEPESMVMTKSKPAPKRSEWNSDSDSDDRPVKSKGASGVVNKFDSMKIINIVINEIKYIYKLSLMRGYQLELIDNNIYSLRLIFGATFFNPMSKIFSELSVENKKVEINIILNNRTYPFNPPKVMLISPRFTNDIFQKICQMNILGWGKWTQACDIELLISFIKEIMESESDIKIAGDHYIGLEYDLISLSLVNDIPINLGLNENMSNTKGPQRVTKKKTVVKKTGIGYGHDSSSRWNCHVTKETKESIAIQKMICVKNITKNLAELIISNSKIDLIGIIKNSIFIPYLKNIYKTLTVLDLTEQHQLNFEIHLDSMRIMGKRFLEVFITKYDGESLFDALGKFNSDCQSYLEIRGKSKGTKGTTGTTEQTNISNFVEFYDQLKKSIVECKNQSIQIHLTSENIPIEEIYVRELESELFKENNQMDIREFDNNSKKNSSDSFDSSDSPQAMSRLAKEFVSIKNSLPLNFNSSIFFRMYPKDIRYSEFLIMGPEGTPYDSGCFHFKIFCPNDYPRVTPHVRTCTTGHGAVKFNPNLYADGKICLSLLNTISGQQSERWMQSESSMLQIMISIQSLIMNSTPYFNELGRETYRSDTDKLSINYNREIRYHCMKWAMLDVLRNPIKGFERVILKHFAIKASYIKKLCMQWIDDAPKSSKFSASQCTSVYKELCAELDKFEKRKECNSPKPVLIKKSIPTPAKGTIRPKQVKKPPMKGKGKVNVNKSNK